MDATASHNLDSAPGGRAKPARRYASGRRALDWSRAFAATPKVRADAVVRARGLIADGNYPPPETINEIALLLGEKLASTRDVHSS
jgi:hypothetical protein